MISLESIGVKFRSNDKITAGLFCFIERRVAFSEQVNWFLSALLQAAHTDTDGELFMLPGGALDAAPEPFTHNHGALYIRIWQNDCKLLPAIAGNQIMNADVFFEQCCHGF